MKSIDLTNKCGSCQNFKPVPGTLRGDCLANPFGDDVVHAPNHPYWQVGRSRIKCAKYRARTKPQTNADRIRAMSDEELARTFAQTGNCPPSSKYGHNCERCGKCWLDYLRQPVKEDKNDA